MKRIAAAGLIVAMGIAAGCSNHKPDTAPAADLNTPAPVTPTPAAYYPTTSTPAQTVTPDVSASNPQTLSAMTGNTYTVKPGDTLWKIAATKYGDGRKWKQIASANPGLTPEKLKVGQTITLP